MVATSTKICTVGGSTITYDKSFIPAYAPAYTLKINKLDKNGKREVEWLERHPFSGLVYSAVELLHTP